MSVCCDCVAQQAAKTEQRLIELQATMDAAASEARHLAREHGVDDLDDLLDLMEDINGAFAMAVKEFKRKIERYEDERDAA